MTGPQPATPGSDSVRAQIAEVLVKLWAEDMGEPDVAFSDIPDVLDEVLTPYLAVLVPVVDSLRAEALEEAADELDATSQLLWDEYKGGDPAGPHRASTYTEGTVAGFDASEQRLRARAAAYRTNPSSEETQRGR